MVTAAELYVRVRARLADGEDAAFDAACLVTDFCGLHRGIDLALCVLPIEETAVARVLHAAEERAAGRPLQYILGEWDFLDLTLAVGEGVLIPRPDTETLCETAAAWIAARGLKTARMLDLCAGSGCVGLGVCSLAKECAVAAEEVELSPEAAVWLDKNLARYPQFAAKRITADVLTDADRFERGAYDLLLSNPPYIPRADLPTLQREVQREPQMALDGGDGYVFYRAIADDWLTCLKPGGLCAVEVGYGQAETVAALFAAAGLQNVTISPDLAGVERVVSGLLS